MNVQHEYVIYQLLFCTFQGKESSWYFSLAQVPITNWEQFKKSFMKKFAEDETPSTLLMNTSSLKLKSKDKIKVFNQTFLTLFNKIPNAS